MFLEQAIKAYVKEPVRCLDLCAAPGGKSTHLASLLPDGSLLVSNEVIRSRSYVLDVYKRQADTDTFSSSNLFFIFL